ncbi:MAG TPA: DUF4115 domain-containing protein, partial [Acidimicrobiales bacterium]|nr:DUF4115 domain-containing protein [Acidimicrobiales bacterium]
SPPAAQSPPASQSRPTSQSPPAGQPAPAETYRAPRFQPSVAAGMSRRRRPNLPGPLTGSRAVVATVAIVAILTVSGVGYVLASHGGSGPGTAVPTTVAPATNRSTAPPTTRPVATTTAPTAPTVVAGAQSSGTAAYTVSSGPVQLAVAASSRCWVELRAVSALGPVVFEGILGPGASRAFENAVGLWMRIGYPAGVALAVDGRPVGLPSSASPLDVTVNSATA